MYQRLVYVRCHLAQPKKYGNHFKNMEFWLEAVRKRWICFYLRALLVEHSRNKHNYYACITINQSVLMQSVVLKTAVVYWFQ